MSVLTVTLWRVHFYKAGPARCKQNKDAEESSLSLQHQSDIHWPQWINAFHSCMWGAPLEGAMA